MKAYIIRRLLLMPLTILFISMTVFLLVRFLPGDIIDQIESQMSDTQIGGVDRAAIERSLGLDAPIYIQYWRWLSGIVLHGDLGTSLLRKEPVTEAILHRWPITFELSLIAIIIGIIVSLPLGIYSAIRQDTAGDYITRSIAIIWISVPTFWVGAIVIIYPAIWFNWSPPIEIVSFLKNPIENMKMFILPATIMGLASIGGTLRMTRTMMLEVLRHDYIRTAWAKGLKETIVISRHALKNALIPVVTIIGLHLPALIGGSVIIEQLFALPGIGRLMIDSLNLRDYPMISGITLFVAAFVVIINLFVDLIYAFLDPRVRYK
jgi:peptide/nickel transport system permease protein